MPAEPRQPSAALSVLLGLALFAMLLALIFFARDLGFSKFIYVDF